MVANHLQDKAKTANPVAVNNEELDKLAMQCLPPDCSHKVGLALLVLDVEGHEAAATKEIQKYCPDKVFMEELHLKEFAMQQIRTWVNGHNLTQTHVEKADTSYNFDARLNEHPDH